MSISADATGPQQAVLATPLDQSWVFTVDIGRLVQRFATVGATFLKQYHTLWYFKMGVYCMKPMNQSHLLS